MQKNNFTGNFSSPEWIAITSCLTIMIEYFFQNVYGLLEGLFSGSHTYYIFDLGWILPDVIGILTEWLVIFFAINFALKRGQFSVANARAIFIFSVIFFVVKITFGRILFMVIYYGFGPILFGEHRPFGTHTNLGSTIFIQSMLLLASLLSFFFTSKLFDLIQRRYKRHFRQVKFNHSDFTVIFLFTLTIAISALTCTYIALLNSEDILRFSTSLSSDWGTLLVQNIIIVLHYIIPLMYALFIFSSKSFNFYDASLFNPRVPNSGSNLYTPVFYGFFVGSLSWLFTYLLIPYIFSGILSYSTTLFSLVIVTLVYHLFLIINLFLFRQVLRKKIILHPVANDQK